MIYLAINHITVELNQFLRRNSIAGEDVGVVSIRSSRMGSRISSQLTRLFFFLTGIKGDTVPGPGSDRRAPAGTVPTYLNLYLMVAANFTTKNYTESLKYISEAIGFFQQHPVFDRHSSPGPDNGIEKLMLDMETIEKRELNNA